MIKYLFLIAFMYLIMQSLVEQTEGEVQWCNGQLKYATCIMQEKQKFSIINSLLIEWNELKLSFIVEQKGFS